MTAPALAAVVAGWRHVYSGKVRDLYLPDDPLGVGVRDAGPDVVLVVASDRISAFDHVLSTPIPDKGRVLTALSLWWFAQLADVVPNHLLPDQSAVPPEVSGRAMLCRRLEMIPVECVARGYLAGSGLAEYRASGAVCGVPLPPGLLDGSRLPEPIFTPATKAPLGEHDENVSFEEVLARHGASTAGQLRELTLAVYRRAESISRERGLVLADTKLEFGRDPNGADGPNGADSDWIMLGDEVLTPDSSRFWPGESWRPGGVQPSFDKQYVRDWLTSPASGWDRQGGEPPPALPEDVVMRTRHRYVQAYQLLTGSAWK